MLFLSMPKPKSRRPDLNSISDFDNKQGHSIYIAPDGVNGWIRLGSLNTNIGPKTSFNTVEERDAVLVCTPHHRSFTIY